MEGACGEGTQGEDGGAEGIGVSFRFQDFDLCPGSRGKVFFKSCCLRHTSGPSLCDRITGLNS